MFGGLPAAGQAARKTPLLIEGLMGKLLRLLIIAR